MIVDMGTTINLLIKICADAHDLTIKEKAAEYISGANGMVVKIVGTSSMNLLLAPTMELDVANIVVWLGNFYQGLLGCDFLGGHNEALSMATITLPRLD